MTESNTSGLFKDTGIDSKGNPYAAQRFYVLKKELHGIEIPEVSRYFAGWFHNQYTPACTNLKNAALYSSREGAERASKELTSFRKYFTHYEWAVSTICVTITTEPAKGEVSVNSRKSTRTRIWDYLRSNWLELTLRLRADDVHP